MFSVFFSEAACSHGHACDNHRFLLSCSLQVRLCRKQKGFQPKVLALSSSKCQDLANHYLGFNGWSKRIIALQNISGLDELETGDGDALQEQRTVKYLCLLEVTLPGHDVCSRGVGVAEEDLDKPNGALGG
ncbi:hypothetical protein FKM82_031276, partial [Ascaphus truei]